MARVISIISQYVSIIFLAVYGWQMFAVLKTTDKKVQNRKLNAQLIFVFVIHFLWYLTLFLQMEEIKILFLYGAEIAVSALYMALYHKYYPKSSRLLTNNMCLLLLVGYTMLTRINLNLAIKQFAISTVTLLLVSFLPILMIKVRVFRDYYMVYGIMGLVGLLSVFIPGKGLIHGVVLNGSRNWVAIGFADHSITFQPSELVKVIFIFFVASALSKELDRKRFFILTGFVFAHLGVLVLEKDLGATLIYFVIFVAMLYIGTRNLVYPLICTGGVSVLGALAFLVLKDRLFSHVMVRINNWIDPWSDIDNKGYQIAQSLFAIGSGGWFGTGLGNGMPQVVPVRESDFIFSIICEEMGLLVGFVLILVYFSIFLGMIRVSMSSKHTFYKNMAFGFSLCFIFQALLNIGGVTKFIPSTGVTLPLVSYGLTSVVCTLIIFQIIQGIQSITSNEVSKVERTKEALHRKAEAERVPKAGTGKSGAQ